MENSVSKALKCFNKVFVVVAKVLLSRCCCQGVPFISGQHIGD